VSIACRQFRLAVAALLVLSGCTPAVEGDGEALKPELKPEQGVAVPEPRPIDSLIGLGGANLLGSAPEVDTPKPNAAAVRGVIFNGAYAVVLGSSDQQRARGAIHTALEWLPVGRSKLWRNPDNGHWGTVTPTRTYQDANGAWCREFHQTVTIGGDENHDTSKACRGADGVWREAG
jgi:surface antigen